jgi:diguanylate cyclase (GGDEF)-like protein
MSDPVRRTTVRDLDRIVPDAPDELKRPRGVAFRAALARVPVPARVWAFSVFLAVAAVALYLQVLDGRVLIPTPISVPWPVVALGFFLAETKVVEVNFRRETHSLSLSEIPAVVGFFFLSPADYLGALLIGTIAALVVISRQSPLKILFNVSNFAITAVVALSVFARISNLDGARPGADDWFAAFAATIVASVMGALNIATVITLSGGAPQFQKLPEMLKFGVLVAIANTSLALLAVSFIWVDMNMLWLLAVPLVVVFLAYRSWISEREKHERLELLYQSSRILQDSPELDSALVALLDHAREMFRAERAEVILYPASRDVEALRTASLNDGPPAIMVPLKDVREDPIQQRVARERRPFLYTPESRTVGGDPKIHQAMVSPLRGESGLIGCMIIVNRLTEGTSFTDDDLRLLETLANQAAVALENGQLEQSLAELSRLKEQLRHQAHHDPLTGLANRTLFGQQVDERLLEPRSGSVAVVLFLDLDDFKVVNDTLGHAAGDRLLVAVAERLRSCVSAEDLAARLGGDEFAILLEDDAALGHALDVAHRIVDALRVSFPIQGQEITIGASIGIAAARDGIARADDLLRNADVAMYSAKRGRADRVAVFEPTMHAAIVARHGLSVELARGVARGELEVVYQPIVALATGKMTGVEALVRWRHPTRGLLGPVDFITIAEENGAILPLGWFVLTEACRDMAAWQRLRPAGERLTVAVNLAAAQLQEIGFVDDLKEMLASTGLDPRDLVLEMTETVMFHDTQTTIARLDALRALGARIAVDDFGTGYSSLGYLRRFKVDVLKIAQEFIAPGDGSSEDWAFAHSIVALGRTLDLRIVAEGIEQSEQLDRLRQLGCEFGQGFLFARPMSASGIQGLIVDGLPSLTPASGHETVPATSDLTIHGGPPPARPLARPVGRDSVASFRA